MKLTRETVRAALISAEWNVRAAAEALGVTRQAVYLAVERFKIRRRAEAPEVVSERNQRAARTRWDRLRETA
jgi:hypothetical protein